MMADMAVPGAASGAPPTPGEGHDGDRIADLPPFDAGADGGNRAGHFMSDHGRGGNPVIHRAVQDMQVRAADAGVRDGERDLALPWHDRLRILHRERTVALIDGTSHLSVPPLSCRARRP